MPKKIPQPHGGALLSGGVPGHKGAGGPKPSEFREIARRLLEDRKLVDRLARIASGEIGEIVEAKDGREYCEAPLREQRGAIETLLKLGVGETGKLSAETVQERLGRTVDLLRDRLPDDVAVPLLREMRAIWQ